MQVPRWFWIACSLIMINAVLVTGTSLQRLVWADSSKSNEPETANDDSVYAGTPAESGEADDIPSTDEQPHDLPLPPFNPINDPLALPDVRSTESLEHDPVFSEIKKMFADPSRALASEPEASRSGTSIAAEHLDRLQRRLDTVIGLTESARSLVEEAAELARDGKPAQSQEMLDMTMQLRRMAIKLLGESL